MSLVDDLYKKEAERIRKPRYPDIANSIVYAIEDRVLRHFGERAFEGYFYRWEATDGNDYRICKSKNEGTSIGHKELEELGYTPPNYNDLIEKVTIRAKEEIGVKEFSMMIEPDIYESIPYGQKRGLFGRNATKVSVVYLYMEAKW